MQLKPLITPELIDLAAGWLAEERNYEWLGFGAGVRNPTPLALKIMLQKDTNVVRVFTADDGVPIGIVGLSNVDWSFKTAVIWIVLGDKRYSMKGYAPRAAAKMLTHGFRELGLHAINCWAVECNHASLRVIQRVGFRPAGRLRQCHYINGRVYDRLLFDLLACEHQEVDQRENEHREISNA
jgi:RimJ/RimL family protein N-acetyltransferase